MQLQPLKNFQKRPGPLVLMIMDGVGIGEENEANAVFKANTPFLDHCQKSPLYRLLKAHGTAVGMPSDDDMGNSEVGHNALGAGRVFEQGASLVKQAIETHSLYKGETWKHLIRNVKDSKSTLHFIGLLSDGNVHAHIDHLISMLQKATEESCKKIRIHTLLDGRDVGQKTALLYIDKLESVLKELQAKDCDVQIASGGGRMVTTMDRYNADWTIVERGWKAHVLGEARHFSSAKEAVKTYYAEDPNSTDQYLDAFVIANTEGPIGTIQDGDSVIFTNFRGDRAIELSMAFELETFPYFDRKRSPKVHYAGMMQYDGDLNLPKHFLVNPPEINNTVSEYLCARGLKTFAISETQKYGHVTYFWNGNKSGYINQELELYLEIPSDKIPFDQAPNMKALEITEKTIALLKSQTYQFGRINFPNGDMVGHTGNFEATQTSVEITDLCVQKIVETVSKLGGISIVLADHGNADIMFTEKNGIRTPKTSHTLNPVPFTIIDSQYKEDYTLAPIENAGLANVAATICNLLGFEAPKDYAPSLIQIKDA